MPATLIHLVSGERMQNLLPILALNPRRVIQICSDDPQILAAAVHTEAAAREAGIHAEFQNHKLPTASPTVEDVRHAHKQLISVFPGAIANITGGNKLMSLGAYLGAGEFHDSPILYCDTANSRFIQVGRGPLPPQMLGFSDVAARLTVPIVMAAQGKSPNDWRFDIASAAELAFGQTAWKLKTQHLREFPSFGNAIRTFYRSDFGKIPSSAEKLRALVAADLTSAFPGTLSAQVRSYLDAAVAAGFLMPLNGGGYCLAEGPSERKKLRSHVERIANLLDGSWLELSVLSFISRSARHRDSRWSVEPSGNTASAEYGETDIVSVQTTAAALEVISCKTALSQPLEHLEGLRTRANNLGGSHALATLTVLAHHDENKLRQWGRLLRVKILIGEEIPTHFT